MTLSRFALAPLALAALLATGFQGTALAQSPHTTAIPLNIASQPLGQALNDLARQAGLQLLFPPALVEGKTAPAVSGRLTPTQALERLLTGSGLIATQQDGTIVVKPEPASDAALPPLTVIGKRQIDDPSLPAPHAGGQVASGSRLGILGNRDVMSTPFNVTSYTSALIEGQMATTLADVLANDSGVRMEIRGQATAVGGGDNFLIRGFALGNRDSTLNGIFGVLPNGTIAVETIERVEVLKGPNALLNGMSPSGGVGGSVNIVPKRAPDAPLTRLTTTYISDAQAGLHLDVGRRFGQDNEFGVRANGIYRNGQTPVDHQKSELSVGVLGLDYRGQTTRLSADIGHQRDQTDRPSAFFTLEPSVTAAPRAPSGRTNVAQPWEKKDFRDNYALLSGEHDLTPELTVYAALGWRKHDHDLFRTENYLIDNDGTFGAYPTTYPEFTKTRTYQAGLRGKLTTGPVSHSYNIGLSSLKAQQGFGYGMGDPVLSNIYDPVSVTYPGFGPTPAKKVLETRLDSFAVADVLSMLEDRLQITLGLRHQQVKSDSFDLATGEKNPDPQRPGYSKTTTTPTVGLLFKVASDLSLYGNYIEGLSKGDSAPVGANVDNSGAYFPPKKAKQKEVGIKKAFGGITATVSVFEITQPVTLSYPSSVTPGNVYYSDGGEQRNRGIEFNSFGEIQPGLRLLGGVTVLKAELRKTQDGVNDGNDATGIPRWMSNIGMEWDPAAVPGLTLRTRLIGTGKEYANDANDFQIPGWVRWDLGVSYKTRAEGHPLVLRAGILNVADRHYWEGVNTVTGLRLAAPRTLSLSASVDF